MTITAAADGSALGNPGPAGWAWYIDDDRWAAEDPTTVQARVVTPMSQEGARLLAESSEWAGVFGTLGQTWRRSPQAAGRGPSAA